MELKVIEEGLLKLLAENHYSERTIKTYKQFWRRLEDFLLEKFGSTEFSMVRGMLYLNERYSFLKNYQRETLPQQRVQYLRMVHLLEDYQLHGVLTRRYYAAKNPIVLDGEYLSIHEGFKAYLQTTQCSKSTANHYTRISLVLLDYLRQKSLEVGSIDLAACNGFLSTFSGYSYKAMEQTTCGLRYFLRYLNETSILANSISDKIHMAKMSKQAKIPCVWEAADLKCLLQTVPRNSPIGKRDYAMILTACILGLRSIDLKHLTLDDFDWKRKFLTFRQHKTGKSITLPIPNPVGWAIIDYIRNGRPQVFETRILFVKHMPPFDPIGDENHLQGIISHYINYNFPNRLDYTPA
jgi:site-specific recombinase XerD